KPYWTPRATFLRDDEMLDPTEPPPPVQGRASLAVNRKGRESDVQGDVVVGRSLPTSHNHFPVPLGKSRAQRDADRGTENGRRPRRHVSSSLNRQRQARSECRRNPQMACRRQACPSRMPRCRRKRCPFHWWDTGKRGR